MAEINYKESTLWHKDQVTDVSVGGSVQISLPNTVKTAARSIKFVQTLLDNDASSYRFDIRASITVSVEYAGHTFDRENFVVFFNRDRNVKGGTFDNVAELKLQGADISSITLNIENHSQQLLRIMSMAMYESDDFAVTSIAKVLKEESIAADLVQVTSVFTDSIFTQILQTNAWSRSARLARAGDTVDFIQAEGMEIGFYTATLGSSTEQFSITVNKAGKQQTYYYWYASISGPDAYQYLTTIDPREKHPDISEANRDAFKFIVYKPSELRKKMSIEFAYDENKNLTPSIIYGQGDQNGYSKGYTYKNTNGFYHVYTTSSGKEVGIRMDNDGVHITGWTDQHCESIKFYNNGVKVKFTGEAEHSFEYEVKDNKLVGIIIDGNYKTSISYFDQNL